MSKLTLKPAHKSVIAFYDSLKNFQRLNFLHEGAVSPPFAVLLESAAKQFKWNLVQQYPKKFRGKSLRDNLRFAFRATGSGRRLSSQTRLPH